MAHSSTVTCTALSLSLCCRQSVKLAWLTEYISTPSLYLHLSLTYFALIHLPPLLLFHVFPHFICSLCSFFFPAFCCSFPFMFFIVLFTLISFTIFSTQSMELVRVFTHSESNHTSTSQHCPSSSLNHLHF